MSEKQNINVNMKDALYIEEQTDMSEFAGFTTASSLASLPTSASFSSVTSCAGSAATESFSSVGD
ncbi:thiocillin family RiPP [Viridibacillus sp. NPDC093762]|uniref:thiocillin family RiPP n=1 Tax=Viridibacillus sp. NPDC093762 TaxID=3390720 RepID=UPI003D09098D